MPSMVFLQIMAANLALSLGLCRLHVGRLNSWQGIWMAWLRTSDALRLRDVSPFNVALCFDIRVCSVHCQVVVVRGLKCFIRARHFMGSYCDIVFILNPCWYPNNAPQKCFWLIYHVTFLHVPIYTMLIFMFHSLKNRHILGLLYLKKIYNHCTH